MTKPNYNEADTVRKGLATIAEQDGASAGDVASVNASGELELVTPSGGGGSLPPQWTVGADGSLTIAPDAPGTSILVINAPVGAAGTALVIRDENGDLIFEAQAESGVDAYAQVPNIAALDVHSVATADDGSPVFRVRADLNGTHAVVFEVDSNGHTRMSSFEDFAVAVDAIGFTSQVVAILQAQTAGGQKLFKVMPDGSLHGKTGQSLVFDL